MSANLLKGQEEDVMCWDPADAAAHTIGYVPLGGGSASFPPWCSRRRTPVLFFFNAEPNN